MFDGSVCLFRRFSSRGTYTSLTPRAIILPKTHTCVDDTDENEDDEDDVDDTDDWDAAMMDAIEERCVAAESGGAKLGAPAQVASFPTLSRAFFLSGCANDDLLVDLGLGVCDMLNTVFRGFCDVV